MKHKKDKTDEVKTDAPSQAANTPIELIADDPVKPWQEKVDALQKERDEVFERLQRLSADYANFQKRVPRQIADTVAYEKEKIVRSMLPGLDNLERTLQHSQSFQDVTALANGVKIVYDQMLDTLSAHGVEQIQAIGQPFEPGLHEALMQRTQADQADNVIVEEYQKGYTVNGRVIRPSKVVVNRISIGEKIEEPRPEGEAEQEGDRTTEVER